MNATDVYVEQLIIGGLVILIAVVLWTGGVPPVPESPVAYVVIAGAAYLAGMIYDRVGDSLLERIEQRLRLSFAKEELVAGRAAFPEGKYRIAVLREGGELARQLGYLRTRMRLTRAVATLLPAATMALLGRHAGSYGPALTFCVSVLYLAVGVANWAVSKRYPVPRTEAAELAKIRPFWSYLAEPVVLGFALLVALMAWTARLPGHTPDWMTVIAGSVGTLATFWTWKRITGTFQAFLRDANAKE